MKVTVLMPVLNEAASVRGAVTAVLRQSVEPAQVLVVDGGSDDGTPQIVADLAHEDARVALIDNPDRTIPAALNRGLAVASGDVVARVDAHATISDTYFERAVVELSADERVVAVGGLRLGVGDGTAASIAAALSSPFGVGDSVNHYASERVRTDHASFGVFRTGAVREVGGWDESLPVNEDVDLDHRLRLRGHEILLDPDMKIYWHVRRSHRDLAFQYRRYGRGKAAMVRKNGLRAVRARHLVPPALVGALGAATLAAALGRPRAAAGLLLPYVAGVAAASARTARSVRRSPPAPELAEQARQVRTPAVAGAFMAMHLAWGLGFLEGLAGRSPAGASARTPPTAA